MKSGKGNQEEEEEENEEFCSRKDATPWTTSAKMGRTATRLMQLIRSIQLQSRTR